MNKVPEAVNNIYQVFIDYYGENNVDLQSYSEALKKGYLPTFEYFVLEDTDYCIFVHWSEVTITNEYDESIVIWDLYCITVVNSNGRLRTNPTFNRSTYDVIQWHSGYCHSHVPSIDKRDIKKFRHSCLGTGPINGTIHKLGDTSFTDLDVWRLYCWELDKYVHVESLSGGPYRRLREVGKEDSRYRIKDFSILFSPPFPLSRDCKAFVRKTMELIFTQNLIAYNYVDGKYYIATPYTNAVLNISNAFIHWYNSEYAIGKSDMVIKTKELFAPRGFLTEAYVQGEYLVHQLSGDSRGDSNVNLNTGLELFMFKGEPVTLQSLGYKHKYEEGEVSIINTDILNYIIYKILNFLNANYGRTNSTSEEIGIF